MKDLNKQTNFELLAEVDNRKSHYKELINGPHWLKLDWANLKIKEFLEKCIERDEPVVTVSFSGGKDSTVLLDLVLKQHKKMKCKIPVEMIYATEVTFPSTIKFIKDTNKRYQEKYGKDIVLDVKIVNPKKTWVEILSENGYPIYSKQISMQLNRLKHCKTKNKISKWNFGIDLNISSTTRYKMSYKRLFLLDDFALFNWPDISDSPEMQKYFAKYNEPYFFSEKCCDFIKGNIKHDNRPSFIGTMAEESELRKKSWINQGCNIYSKKAMKSRPMSIWTHKDIWKYIKDNDLEINSAYGFDRTKSLEEQKLNFTRLGCTSCPYGSCAEDKIVKRLKAILEAKGKLPEKQDNLKALTKNRFEALKDINPALYKAQVISNGMYRILIDMGIEIPNDPLYTELYIKRQRQIENWYSNKNIRKNIIRVMCQVENYDNYKKKGEGYIWNYEYSEFAQAMDYFNIQNVSIDKLIKEVDLIRKDVKKAYRKNYLSK